MTALMTASTLQEPDMAKPPQMAALASVGEALSIAAAKCREALAAPEFAGLAGLTPDAPRDAEGWFDLLSKYDQDLKAGAALHGMRKAFLAERATSELVNEWSLCKFGCR